MLHRRTILLLAVQRAELNDGVNRRVTLFMESLGSILLCGASEIISDNACKTSMFTFTDRITIAKAKTCTDTSIGKRIWPVSHFVVLAGNVKVWIPLLITVQRVALFSILGNLG